MQSAECKVQSDCTKKLSALIGLQFFAEDFEDYEDDFDDVPEYYGWDHEDEPDNEGSDADDAEDAEEDNPSAASGVSSFYTREPENEDAEDAEEDDAEGEDEDNPSAASGVSSLYTREPENEDSKDEGGADAHAELISELRALGYVGDDLASIAQDMRRKREDAKAAEASTERRARNSEGKGHISSAKPQRSVGGDGNGGFTAKQVRNLQQTLGCSYDRARELLAKQVRAIG